LAFLAFLKALQVRPPHWELELQQLPEEEEDEELELEFEQELELDLQVLGLLGQVYRSDTVHSLDEEVEHEHFELEEELEEHNQSEVLSDVHFVLCLDDLEDFL